jgi:very-short-patch-repair endonuclease
LWVERDWGGFPKVCPLDSPQEMHQEFGPKNEISFWIKPQAKIGAYRADFLLWFEYGKTVAGVVVECDGHDFHERTKEQASRDKKRDREILKAGFPVVRFTGSDIYKSPSDCAEQVGELLSDALDRVSRAAGLYA